jgi:agmatinase
MIFGGITTEYSSFDESMFVVVPVPYDLTTTYQAGARNGPAAIIDASCQMELYDEELAVETYRKGIHTTEFLEIEAGGPREMIQSARRQVAEIVVNQKIPVVLGGEHSITMGAVQALSDTCPSLSVLHLDAHADLRDSYQGTPYSHACVSRRIIERCPVVQVGIRSMSIDEAVFMKERGIPSYSAAFVNENDEWEKEVCSRLTDDVYISIDLDVFDPSIMPAVGTPEPGGIYWKDVISLMRQVSERCTIRGFDVVELAPIPGMVAPDFTAAKLVYRIMGYIASQ